MRRCSEPSRPRQVCMARGGAVSSLAWEKMYPEMPKMLGIYPPLGSWVPKANFNLILMTSMHNLTFYCQSTHTISKPGLRLWVEFKLYWVKTQHFCTMPEWEINCWVFSLNNSSFFSPFPDTKMVFKKVKKEVEEASREQWTLRAWYLFIYGFNPSVGKTSEHLKDCFYLFSPISNCSFSK